MSVRAFSEAVNPFLKAIINASITSIYFSIVIYNYATI